ncbi:hypothetical protein ACFLZJ_00350 [Nanoarchaeota archaeon]
MEQIEKNVIISFNKAKGDIVSLKGKINELVEVQAFLMRKIGSLNVKPKTLTKTKTIVKTVTKNPKKIFVASKEGKSFHLKTCPFAKNIKPKTKLIFKTKNTALNKGYKPCKCVN